MRVSLQLYTVRNEISADLPGTLAALAKAGLKFVEGGGLSVEEAKTWKKLLDENGLQMSGAHYGLKAFEAPDDVFEAMEIVGCNTVIDPWEQPSNFETLDGVKQLAEKLTVAGMGAHAGGFEYLYHNHDFEFTNQFEGKSAWEHMVELTNPAWVNFEVDLAWVKIGGYDEIKLINDFSSRVGALHLKDTDPTKTPRWTIAGEGTVNLDAALKFADEHNIGFGCIELDESPCAPLEAVAKSFAYFSSKGYN
jgi:sugar phosphate isomerase/epimerase